MFYYTGVLFWVCVLAILLFHIPSILTHLVESVIFTYRLYKITTISSAIGYFHLLLYGFLLFVKLESTPESMTNVETAQKIYWPGKEPVMYEDGSAGDYRSFD